MKELISIKLPALGQRLDGDFQAVAPKKSLKCGELYEFQFLLFSLFDQFLMN